MWGFLPIYFHVTAQVPALQVLAHRVVWAVPFGALIIWGRRQWPQIRAAIKRPATLLGLLLSACLIAVNWLIYIWAVQNNDIFQASLGYYINPLMYVLVGVGFFAERLRRAQLVAVLLAGFGVLVLTTYGGRFPWIALTLAASFTAYGVIRKQIVIGAMPGLFIETLWLFPILAGYLIWLGADPTNAFTFDQPGLAGLLVLAGPLTVLPLLFFAVGARKLRLSTLGFLQFIGPTLQFAVGVAYGETLSIGHLICFGLIWIAVALFSIDAWRQSTVPAPRAQL